MNTYTIETAHGTLDVQGDHFGPAAEDVTGEFYGWEVTKGGELASFIAPGTLISVVVK